MPSLPRILVQTSLAGILLSGASLARAAEMELLSSSPFLPANSRPSTAAITEGGPLEFRALVPDAYGVVKYSIYYNISGSMPPKKTSVLVAENETFTSSDGLTRFTVRGHKVVDGNDQVSVDYAGQTLNLALRTPKIASTNTPGRGGLALPTLPAVNNGQPVITRGGPPGGVPAVNPGGRGQQQGAAPNGRGGAQNGAANNAGGPGGRGAGAAQAPAADAASIQARAAQLAQQRAAAVAAPETPAANQNARGGGRGRGN